MPKNICSYVALSSNGSGVPKGISLMIYYGQPAVGAFSGFFHHTEPIVTNPGTPAGLLTYKAVRVHGLDAYWQPGGEILSAIDKNYVLHITVQGSASGESVAEKALQGIEQRLG